MNPVTVGLLMALGVAAVSTSGPIMAAMVVPPLAVSFWRNAFAVALLTPQALTSRRAELRSLAPRQAALIAGSGLALAIHFATWVTALRLTSVASATALVSLQIAWVVAWQMARGERFGAGVVAGLCAAFAGVLVVSGVDFTLSREALVGDLLALVGGMAAAGYILVGARARRTVSTTSYTFLCYGCCALILLLACPLSGQALVGYAGEQWLLLALVALLPQMLGHSVFNHLLAVSSPMVVSLALLLEVPGAALLAAWLLGQRPPAGALVGLALILAGMALVIVRNRRSRVGADGPAPID